MLQVIHDKVSYKESITRDNQYFGDIASIPDLNLMSLDLLFALDLPFLVLFVFFIRCLITIATFHALDVVLDALFQVLLAL